MVWERASRRARGGASERGSERGKEEVGAIWGNLRRKGGRGCEEAREGGRDEGSGFKAGGPREEGAAPARRQGRRRRFAAGPYPGRIDHGEMDSLRRRPQSESRSGLRRATPWPEYQQLEAEGSVNNRRHRRVGIGRCVTPGTGRARAGRSAQCGAHHAAAHSAPCRVGPET